jgi:hypothetical protein
MMSLKGERNQSVVLDRPNRSKVSLGASIGWRRGHYTSTTHPKEMTSIDVIIVGFGQNHQSKAFTRSCLTTFGRDLEDEAE